jgi:hypothetical protein
MHTTTLEKGEIWIGGVRACFEARDEAETAFDGGAFLGSGGTLKGRTVVVEVLGSGQ